MGVISLFNPIGIELIKKSPTTFSVKVVTDITGVIDSDEVALGSGWFIELEGKLYSNQECTEEIKTVNASYTTNSKELLFDDLNIADSYYAKIKGVVKDNQNYTDFVSDSIKIEFKEKEQQS